MKESFSFSPEEQQPVIIPHFDFEAYKEYSENGTESSIERKHKKYFLKSIHRYYCGFQNNNSDVSFSDYVEMAKVSERLISSFGNSFETAENDLIEGLAYAFATHLHTKDPIDTFSVASNALESDGGLKDKSEQYSRFDLINEICANIFDQTNISFRYKVYLADIDYQYEHQGNESRWKDNIDYLSSSTTQQVSTIRNIFPDCDSMIEDDLRANAQKYEIALERYEKNEIFKFKFGLKKERALYQMALYSAVGKFFEDKTPTAILFDVQKRVYPYEQPYYQHKRVHKLPIIRGNIQSK